MTKGKGGTKYDTGKNRLSLIDPNFLWQIGLVLTFGAQKYDPYNWQGGIDYSRMYDALQRHLTKFWAGEFTDEETGLPHLAHAAVNCMFLLWHTIHKPERDDRPLDEKS